MNDSNSSPMPLSRQLRYQKQCRDNWKEKALQKQHKLREYLQLTRSLKRSRDTWKNRAKLAEQRVKELEEQLAQYSSSPQHSSDSDDDESEDVNEISEQLSHHHYSLSTISLVVQQFISVGHTYRGITKTMQLISSQLSFDSPHYTTIKSWVERLGLYELQRPKPKRDDWLYIADLTLELGDSKALVIYGIPKTFWLTQILPQKRALKHTDGQILALEVTPHATSDWIHSVLESTAQSVGTPLQIIADRGSNLKKGIELFHSSHSPVIYTYDVTHALANLLKKELFTDDIFQSFLSDCDRSRQQLQQTDLAFAAPPPQRTQCRYFNLQRLLNWALHILHSNLSLFEPLLPHLNRHQLFTRLLDKFSWVFSYEFFIQIWLLLLKMIRLLEKQLKTEGLHSASLSVFRH
ncbi:MAG: hypothetical protein AAGF26_15865, partial [Cyanobacteria bacterium P01_G01_bin.49]